MPLYDLECVSGHRFERFIKLSQLPDRQTCECGAAAMRLISAPRVQQKSDTIEPVRGPDGKMHTSLASYRRSCEPGGNPQGERYVELGNEEMPEFKAPVFDRGKRREAIKAGIQDVKEGRVPPVVTGDLP